MAMQSVKQAKRLAAWAAAWVGMTGLAWGQWSGTNPLTTTSSVGIGVSNPSGRLSIGYDTVGVLNLGIGNLGLSGGNSVGNLHIESTAAMYLNYYSNQRILMGNGNVGIGTPSPAYKLSVNGTIQAKEVLVNTGWADHVFLPQYRLKPLGEVASYIREKGHLPGIPSEAEVKERGVGLGEMHVKLLEKIEELTLHMIAAEERSRLLERKNRDLEERLSKLAARVEGGVK